MSHSNIESLSAEVWCEIFEFFDVIQLFRIFGNLNSTIDSILSYSTPLHLKIFSDRDYDFVSDVILPKVKNRANVKAIKFRHEFQIEDFFVRWPLSSFQQLHCLSLVYLGEMGCDCSISLLEQLGQLPFLDCLYIRVGRVAYYDRCFKRLIQLIFAENDALPSLKQLIVRCDDTNQLFFIPTAAKQMQLESVTLSSVYLAAFLSFLPRALHLKSIKLNSLFSDEDRTTSVNAPPSKVVLCDCIDLNLHLAYHLQFDGIKLVLETVPNLTQLKINCDHVLANGRRWETLLEEHCPRLRRLEIRFSPRYRFFQQVPLTDLQQSFTTNFWLERNVQIEPDDQFYQLTIRFQIDG